MSDVLYVNLDALTTEYNKKIDAAIGRLEKLGDDAVKNTQKAEKSSTQWGTSLMNMAKGFIAVDLASRVAGAVKQVFLLEEAYKKALMPLQGITEKSGNFGRVLDFNKMLADKYGQSIFVLSEEYKSLYATADAAGISLNSTNSIYESLIKTGSGLQLSNERISLSMRAITQMIDKQVVSSEELKGQLAEHIPGAYALMAKAAKDAGISTTGTTQELAKLLEEGKVASNVVLPFFAKRMEEAFGGKAAENVNTITGSANRMRNELTYMMDALDQGKVLSFWATMQNGIADTFKDITYLVNSGSWSEFVAYITGSFNQTRGKRIGNEILMRDFSAKSLKDQIAEFRKLQADFNLSKDTNLFLIGKGVNPNTSFVTETAKTLKQYAEIIKSTAAQTNNAIKPPTFTPVGKKEKAKADTKNHGILSQMPDFLFTKIDKSKKDPLQAWIEEKAKETKALLDKSSEVLGEKAKKLADRVVVNMATGFENTQQVTDAIKKLGIDISDGFDAAEMDRVLSFVEGMQSSIADATAMVNGFLQSSFSFLSDTFATGFASVFSAKIDFKQSFKPILSSFLISLGDMITQMGQKMLVAAIAKDTAIKALSSFFGAGIPAAVALIGVGSALKGGGMAINANSNLGSSMNGGNYSGGGGYNNYNNFNRNQNSQSMPKAINIVFENGALKGYMNYQDRKYNG